MILEKMLSKPTVALMHAERYVNSGSPTGFSRIADVSAKFHPMDGEGSFILPLILGSDIEVIGEVPQFFTGKMPTHPEFCECAGGAEAIPTSSTRTVFLPQHDVFVKLHYPKQLGRAPRHIGRKEIVRATHINNILDDAKGLRFGYLPEIGGTYSPSLGYGAIVRESRPADGSRFILPAFSLFSQDMHNPGDPLLLSQLMKVNGNQQRLARSLSAFFVDAYNNNLLFEAHAQNVLVEYSPNMEIKRLVIRDFGDCYVDGPDSVAMTLGKLDGESKRKFRSMIYDFKFGEYLLKPISERLGRRFEEDYKESFRFELERAGLSERFNADFHEQAYAYPASTEIRVNGLPNLVEKGRPRFR